MVNKKSNAGDEMDDITLLTEIQKNNQIAFQVLFERYARYVAAVAVKVGGSRLTAEDAEEICSDVFVTLWRKRDCIILYSGTLKPYIGILAKNKTLNTLRAITGKDLSYRALDENAVSDASSEEQYLHQEEAAALMRTIGSLDALDRELFIRRYFYLEKITDIAADKNMNMKTASARILRAKRQLERLMKKEVMG